jgi:hypothetical protein
MKTAMDIFSMTGKVWRKKFAARRAPCISLIPQDRLVEIVLIVQSSKVQLRCLLLDNFGFRT